jgi:putative cardiolipin synthase
MTMPVGLIVVLGLGLILLTIRFLGARRFKVIQTVPISSPLNTKTSLYQIVKKRLIDQDTSTINVLYSLKSPHIAMLTRIHLADKAESTLDLQYYLFHNDQAGQAVLAATVAAAQRGVKVRLLLDDMDMAGRDEYFKRLVKDTPNLELRIFNPFYLRRFRMPEFPARFPPVTRRMHNKSFTADGIVSIVGGRNIGNEYFDVDTEVAFADLDMLMGGEAAQEITTRFNQYWYSGIAFDIERLCSRKISDSKYQQWLNQLNQHLTNYRAEVNQRRDVIDRLIQDSNNDIYFAPINVLADPPHKVLDTLWKKDNDYMSFELIKLIKLIRSAQQDLWISSPYFIPGKEGLKVFQELRDRNVTITILTNSFAANDVAAVHAGYMKYRKRLLKMGVKLYELQAPLNSDNNWSFLGSKRASLHAKALIIDHQYAFVGSFNLDPRSAIHNTEMGIVFNSEHYGEKAIQHLQRYLETQAYELKLSKYNKIEWCLTASKTHEAKKLTHEPNVAWYQRIILTIIAVLPVEWLM